MYRREALAYVRGHLSRLPTVEGVRLLRIVGLYKTSLYVRADAFIEGRNPVWISWAALYSFWVLALLAIAGRRRAPPSTRGRRHARRPSYPADRADRRGARDRARHLREHALSHERLNRRFVVLAAVAIDAGIPACRSDAARRRAYESARN